MTKTQKAQTPQKSIHIIQYKHETSRIKKKSPNCYILFRKDELTNRTHKMTKVEFDKQSSAKWKAMSEDEKNQYKAIYEINRHNAS